MALRIENGAFVPDEPKKKDTPYSPSGEPVDQNLSAKTWWDSLTPDEKEDYLYKDSTIDGMTYRQMKESGKYSPEQLKNMWAGRGMNLSETGLPTSLMPQYRGKAESSQDYTYTMNQLEKKRQELMDVEDAIEFRKDNLDNERGQALLLRKEDLLNEIGLLRGDLSKSRKAGVNVVTPEGGARPKPM